MRIVVYTIICFSALVVGVDEIKGAQYEAGHTYREIETNILQG